MSNFDSTDPASAIRFVRENLPRHKQFALATITATGTPWVVCVNLTTDKALNFIWKSQADALHSQNIQVNEAVSICVFSETEGVGDFGLYCSAVAHEVTDPQELTTLLELRHATKGKPVPPLTEFSGDASARIYYAKVTEAWVNDDRHLKTAIDLDLLRA